jgi:hypothetical protein
MPQLYAYFIASLPMLHFGSRAPFSFEKFVTGCEELIGIEEAQIIRSLRDPALPATRPTIAKWLDFETVLRNELVKIRAGRKRIEPEKYLRPDGYAGPAVYHVALAAYRAHSPLEGEKILDQERWNFLEELCIGHYFDLDFLIIYAYKLLILERWEKINTAHKHELLEAALSIN